MQKIFILISIIFLITFSTALSFSGNGSGTEEDPYQITNVHQLQEMNDDLDAHYILMNDIDASETREWNVGDHDEDPETPDSAMGFKPVGDFEEENPIAGFTGTLNGHGYSINGLYINRPVEDYVGLFGCITDGGYVYDLHIEEADVIGDHLVGVFVGRAYAYEGDSEVNIDGCSSGGFVEGSNNVGGFCGGNYAHYGTTNIKDSYSISDATVILNNVGGFCGTNYAHYGTASISGSYANGYTLGGNSVGGFCGNNYAYYGTARISDSYANGDVKGPHYYVGGFCGVNYAWNSGSTASISGSYANVKVSAKRDEVGGFCGMNFSFLSGSTASIRNSYATGNATGNDNVGGFCGKNEGAYGTASIWDSYTTGDASGKNSVGGFCGLNYTHKSQAIAKIKRCYSIGVPEGSNLVGGFCGNQQGPGTELIISSYFDTQTSGTTEISGGTGKTTAEMMMQSTFENWDFDNVWCLVEGKTYPKLQHFVDCDTLVSVPEIDNDGELEIYPNPATDRIIISSSQYIQRIKIINMLGDVVKEIKPEGFAKEINVSAQDLPKGIYFIIIKNRTGQISRQILII